MIQRRTDALPSPVLTLWERHGRRTQGAALRFGIPLARGLCFNHRALALINDAGERVPACFEPVALWPDKSLQWCQVSSRIDLAPAARLNLSLRCDLLPSSTPSAQLPIEESGNELCVHGPLGGLRFDTARLRLPDIPEAGLTGWLELSVDGRALTADVTEHRYRCYQDGDQQLGMAVDLAGQLSLPAREALLFRCHYDIDADSRCARIEGSLTLHNPAAAQHPGGIWDLGDPHSLRLDRLTAGFNAETLHGGAIRTGVDSIPEHFESEAWIRQFASGGDNWRSPAHVDSSGNFPLSDAGYQLQLDGEVSSGRRADPTLLARLAEHTVSLHIEDFWQRFPSGLAATPGRLSLELVPEAGGSQELQPGERITTRFRLLVTRAREAADGGDEESSGLAEPFPEVLSRIDEDYLQHCALPGLGNPSLIDPRLQELVNAGISGSDNFFKKREVIDEFGWRHFGDIYADHETEGYDGERLFVSHYNNQYDPLFGFIRQYLLSGDSRWKTLADDLARHVVDIDIYHTKQDRPEYNQGMFWHTDHYLPAETASHRAYSRLQESGAYEGHAHGGGPGGQHCYTTGLLWHYLLSGDIASREALFALRGWIERVYEGSGSLADVVLAVKNRDRADLKNHLTGRYPLDRGSANYLHALLDCHQLQQDAQTLEQIEYVIEHTLHPADAIETRALENVEECWYYVVFLQALCRYLDLKAEREETEDDRFCYARDALLHYTDWMLANEAPYLHRPEILEFPNHTWTAQDLRKANVLFAAAYWAPEGGKAYAAKGSEFVDYVADTLAAQPTRHYTRILALIMQNLVPTTPLPSPSSVPARRRWAPRRTPGILKQGINLARLFLRAVFRLRPRREVRAIQRLLSDRRSLDATP